MSGKGKLADSWAVLQQAAMQAAEEDQLEASNGLLEAADEIASWTGFPSPLRKKAQQMFDSSRLGNTQESANSLALSDSNVQIPSVSRKVSPRANTIADDADNLLRQMGITPREILPESEMKLDVELDDLNALRALGGKKALSRSPSPPPPTDTLEYSHDSRSPSPPDRRDGRFLPKKSARESDRFIPPKSKAGTQFYMKRLQGRNPEDRQSQRFLTSSMVSRGAASVSTSRATLSVQLAHLSPDRLQALGITNEFQAMMLQNMSEFRPTSGSSSARSRGSSKRAGNSESQRSYFDTLAQPRDEEHHRALVRWARQQEREAQMKADGKAGSSKKKSAKKSQGGDSDDESDEKRRRERDFYAFLSRQEGEAKARRETLEYESAKKDYDARLDKKQCPQCNAAQSFDEMREKRRMCPQCHVAYAVTRSWAKIARQFLRRTTHHAHQRMENIEVLRRKIIEAERGLDKEHGSDKMQLDAFLARLDEAMQLREWKLQKVKEEMYKNTTFQPQTKASSAKPKAAEDGAVDDDVSVLSSDPVHDFLLRYEEDLMRRRKERPQKYLASHRERRLREQEEEAQRFRF